MDTELERTFATGIAGFSHVIDSLKQSNMQRLKLSVTKNGIAKDFEIERRLP